VDRWQKEKGYFELPLEIFGKITFILMAIQKASEGFV
jgi:hypothetical protein